MKKSLFIALSVLFVAFLFVSCDSTVNDMLAGDDYVTITLDTTLYVSDVQTSSDCPLPPEDNTMSKEEFLSEFSTCLFSDPECTQPFIKSTRFSFEVKKGTTLSEIILYWYDSYYGEVTEVSFYPEFFDHEEDGEYYYGYYDKDKNRIDGNTPINSDITLFEQGGIGCVAQGCAITMADGTVKNVEDIVLGDEVLTWDFYSGSLVGKKVISLDKTPSKTRPVITITTDEGTVINIVDVQSFFDMDAKKYFNISNMNYKYQVGRNIMVCHDGQTIGSEKIASIVLHEETLDLYDIITEDSLNFVSDGALTVVPLLLGFNPYEINDDLKYDPEKMAEDRAKYGLTKYEDFASYASEEAFNKLRLEELQILLGKGLITPDYLTFAITKFYQSTVGIR